MGTSINQGSPKRDPSWIAARTALGSAGLELHRQSVEIWRAANSDQVASLASALSSASVGVGARVAQSSPDIQAALRTYSELLSKRSESSLFTEIARRALARAVMQKSGGAGFAGELFAETAAYYVARDLPSVVGVGGRVESASAAVHLKRSLSEIARQAAMETAKNSPLFQPGQQSASGWRAYVRQVLTKLSGETS